MSQTVTLPDGSMHEFPDEATPAQIQDAVRKFSPQSLATPPGPKSPQTATERGVRGLDVPNVPPVPEDTSFWGGLRTAETGLLNNLIGGMQRTSPITTDLMGKERYGPPVGIAQSDILSPDTFSYVQTRSGNSRNLDPQNEVILLDNAGRPLVYTRKPETNEGALASLGRIGSMGFSAAPFAVGATSKAVPMLGSAAETVDRFKKLNIDPVFAAVAKSRPAQILHNFMLDFLPTAGPVERADTRMLNQTGKAVTEAAGKYGEPGATTDAGAALKQGAEAFVGPASEAKLQGPQGVTKTLPSGGTYTQYEGEAARQAWEAGGKSPAEKILTLPTRATSFKDKSAALYQRLDATVPTETVVEMKSTVPVLTGTRFDNPELQAAFADPTMTKWAQAIASGKGNLSWRDARNFRTEIGKLIAKPMILNDQDRATLNSLYGSVTQDLQSTAATIPGAGNALARADQYYGAGAKRIRDTLGVLLKPGTSDEQAFDFLLKTGQAGSAKENAKRLIALRRSIPDDQWGDVAATVFNRLGDPVASAQDVTGQTANFAPATFMTRYGKLSDTAKDTLFGATGTASRQSIDNLVDLIQREAGIKRVANFSGTARQVSLGALGAGLVARPIETVLTIVGSNVGARVMMHPAFVRWTSGLSQVQTKTQLAQKIAALGQMARMDPALQEAYQALSNATADQAQRTGP